MTYRCVSKNLGSRIISRRLVPLANPMAQLSLIHSMLHESAVHCCQMLNVEVSYSTSTLKMFVF